MSKLKLKLKPKGKAIEWGAGEVAVLGLDPATRYLGLVTLGWNGELLNYLQWNLPKNMGIEERLPMIKLGLQQIIRQERPAAIAYEHGRGAYAAPELDVILRRLPSYFSEVGYDAVSKYSPSHWRMVVCGNGGLDKEAAWKMMAVGYPDFRKIPEDSADARDAYGIARCWWEEHQPGVAVELFDPSTNVVRVKRNKKRE